MNKPEQLFYQSLKRATPDWFWQRLEDSITSGIPDCLCVPSGDKQRAVMIELKALPRTNVQIRKSQVAWITRYAAKGGDVWVINKCTKSGIIQCWKAPFPVVVGRVGHGKIVCDPTLIVSDLSKLQGHHLTNPVRIAV